MFNKIEKINYFENLLVSEQAVIKPRDLGRDSVNVYLNSDMTSFNIDASAGLGKKIRKSMGKIVVKEKDILQYTMKGLSLAYKKRGSNTTFKLRNVIECPFNIIYPIFSPVVSNFFIENINHSVEYKKETCRELWKKYKKSTGYRIQSSKKATFNFNFVSTETENLMTKTTKKI